jgi:AraC-like DNA-binding protein
MQTIPVKGHLDLSHQTLTLNGSPSIQLFTPSCRQQGTILKKENGLLFVISGILHVRSGRLQYSINKGEMAFLAKDTLIEYSAEYGSSEEDRIEYLLVTLTCDLVKEFAKIVALPVFACGEKEPFTITTIDTGLQKYIDCLQIYFGQTQKVEESLVKIKLLELLFYLLRYYNQILILVLDIKESYRADVTQAVEENLLNSLSLSQLAVLSGRSLSSFRRDFLSTYKMPPSQWIRQKRLEKAKELLQSTNMTITDICYTTGFENIAHFSRLFKSEFTHSPSAYRQNTYAA